MALSRSDDIGFSRGLVTDVLGVEGALLKAEDVIIRRSGELRKRGGKRALMDPSAGDGVTSHANAFSSNSIGVLHSFANTSGVHSLACRPRGDASFTSLGTARLNSAGATPLGFGFSNYHSMFVHDGEIMTATGFDDRWAPARWSGSKKARYATG